MSREEVVRELPLGVRIVEELRLVEVDAELLDDIVRVFADLEVEMTDERLSGREHRAEAALRCLAGALLVEEILRLEEELFGGLEAELSDGDDLSRALADADIADAVLTRITPIAIIAGILFVAGDRLEGLQDVAELALADALDERLEALIVACAVLEIIIGDSLNGLGDALRGDGADDEAIALCVLCPLSAEDHVEVCNTASADLTAHAEESDIRDVVLAAAVEAAARLDAELLNIRVKIVFDDV